MLSYGQGQSCFLGSAKQILFYVALTKEVSSVSVSVTIIVRILKKQCYSSSEDLKIESMDLEMHVQLVQWGGVFIYGGRFTSEISNMTMRLPGNFRIIGPSPSDSERCGQQRQPCRFIL